ncbi:YwmB family TATA-box binding protein [Aquibacillus sp. 3ASR75-11]|uniref:YwmB family TATA-box binding protein n=1 Tax=Terrihalobacillus insolitus TaxID=2950438 RepID=A0A9X4AMN9_9BACI|nr:YwmB family TATA-box binding protein [Terrihalobacillus insolitus]MDC3425019.1 YwmB family TATA-box binding protein [Terrihalobacillus insolitus]
MKKSYTFIAIIVLLLSIIYVNTTNATTSSFREIKEMDKALQRENLEVSKWQIIVKESVTRDRMNQLKPKVKEFFSVSTFETEETSEVEKLSAPIPQKNKQVTEQFTILEPKASDEYVEVIYTMTGTVLNEDTIMNNSSKLAKLSNTLFTSKMLKFSCVTSTTSDKINSVNFFEKIEDTLQVQPLNQLDENGFHVQSGYTQKWESSIPYENNQMNVQVAIREGLGGKTTITIGTPIITSEY